MTVTQFVCESVCLCVTETDVGMAYEKDDKKRESGASECLSVSLSMFDCDCLSDYILVSE